MKVFMDIGDEPYATFFALLKAKMQRESMHMLLLDDDEIIEDETSILNKITRFYGDLFQLASDSPKVQEAQRELLQHTTVNVIESQREEIKKPPIT